MRKYYDCNKTIENTSQINVAYKAHLTLIETPSVYIGKCSKIGSLPNKQLRLESSWSSLVNQAN
jgi:hypothetical protein